MDKFHILPTDERFLALEPEQKTCIFESIMNIADTNTLKYNYLRRKEIEELRYSSIDDHLSPGLIKRIKEAGAKIGKTKGQMEEELKERATMIVREKIKQIKDELSARGK